jgi:hypothetical protein
MDLTAIVKELMQERDLLDDAILSLERIAMQRGKRRGRPPAWMRMLEQEVPTKTKKRGRPPRSAAPTS